MATNEFTAYMQDAESRRVVRQLSEDAIIHRGTVRNAARAFQSETSPDILLVDLDGEQNPLAHMATLLRVCRPQTTILATGSENNVTLANDLYRGGVFLYMPKPLSTGDLTRGLREVEVTRDDEEAHPEIQTSRLVLVVGKSMGTNTVTALVARLAAERGRYVACLDLDQNFGTLALAFDTEPERGLTQALRNHDAVAIERLQSRVSARIGLIAHPFDQAGSGEAEDSSGLPDLVSGLAAHAHIILACGATLTHVEALRHLTSDHFIVFEPTPAGVSVAARWLRILEGTSTTLVLNHARPLPPIVSADQIRKSLGDRDPDVTLRYIKQMARAMALGEPERAIGRQEREALESVVAVLTGTGAQTE